MIRFTGITFDPNFSQNAAKNFDECQKYIDNKVLQLSDPYVPMKEGELKESGTEGTVVGSGVIEYTAPYGRKQYYENAGMGKEGVNKGGGLRGKEWFERMKADHKDEILEGLKKL